MVTMFVRHKVNDFGAWKRTYDEFEKVRKQKGVAGATVHREAGNPNMIFVTHQFKDMNAAKTFADSQELKSAMMKSGVSGQPEMWFTEDVERTPH